jgi:heat shock protein HtpX
MTNTLKTAMLLGVMSALLLILGESLGGAEGLAIGFLFAVVTNFASYWFSDKIVLAMYRAKEVGADHRLYRVVARLAERANLPMPKVYIIPQPSPNAFATGRNPQHAAVAATEGILQILSEEELEGVIAHELAHVKHRDILLSSIAATLAATIMMVARFAMFFGGGRRDDRGGNPIAALATIILAPVAAMLIQAAISRSREFAADAGGAAIAGHPMGLVSALRKIEGASRAVPLDANPATAHMFIIKPFSIGGMLSLFSTHPPTEQRIQALLQRLAVLPAESDLFRPGMDVTVRRRAVAVFRPRRPRCCLALRQAVPVLKNPHHRFHLVRVRRRRVLLAIQALEARRHRRELSFDEFHEMGAGAVLEVHDVAAHESCAVVSDGFHRPLHLRARRRKTWDDRRHEHARVNSGIDELPNGAQALQRVRGARLERPPRLLVDGWYAHAHAALRNA